MVAFDGDLTFIRGKAYHWPTSYVASATFLQNDGAGNLTWVAAGGGAGGVSGNGTINRLTKWSTAAIPGTLVDAGIDDDGTHVILQRDFLYSRVDGSCNLGDTSNRIGGCYIKNTLQLFSGGSTSGPISSGFRDSAAGEANRFWINGVGNAWQSGNGTRTALYSYHSLELRGNRRNAGAGPAYTVISGTDSSGVLIYQETDVCPLVINTAINVTSDLFTIQNVGANKFRVATLGTTWMDGGIRNNLFNNITSTGGGQTFDLSNYFNYYTLIFDSGVAAFTFTLPLLTAAWHGFRYRLICRDRGPPTGDDQVRCRQRYK